MIVRAELRAKVHWRSDWRYHLGLPDHGDAGFLDHGAEARVVVQEVEGTVHLDPEGVADVLAVAFLDE
jgi:hypothetical protein